MARASNQHRLTLSLLFLVKTPDTELNQARAPPFFIKSSDSDEPTESKLFVSHLF